MSVKSPWGYGPKPVRAFRLGACVVLMLACVAGMASLATAKTIYVDAGTTAPGDGASWNTAYTDLQSALAAASSGDQIWVAEGTYKPTDGTDRNATFQLINGVALYGGFADGETSLSQRDWARHETILSADLAGNDVEVTDPANLLTELTRSENSYHVVTGSGTDATAVLDGFTVTGGNAYEHAYSYASSDPNLSGGGMYNESGSPTVANCTFTSNASYFFGGGMYNIWGSPAVQVCTFSGNFAGSGGGMYNFFSSPAVTHCTFVGNSARSGGAMNNNTGSPTVTNCTFSGNSADYGGGGMRNMRSNSRPAVTNCTFSGNSADYGGGMANEYGSDPTLKNTIVANNTGGDCACDETSSIDSAGYNLDSDGSCITDGVDHDMTRSDPLLGPLQDNGGPTLTQALLPGSPAIDAIPSPYNGAPSEDQRGFPRPDTWGSRFADIGAVERQLSYDINDDGAIDLLDVVLCAQIAQGTIEGTAAQRAQADIDSDGDVDMDDVSILSDFILATGGGAP